MGTYINSLTTMPALLVYLLVAVLVLGESAAFVGLVLPGETALLAGGAVTAVGHASLPVLIGAASVGAITGDAVGYWIGRRFGPTARTSRAGRWVGEARWARAEDVMARRGAVAVLTGRWIGVLRALVPAVAGMTGMPYRRYMLFNVVGGVLWVAGVSTVGYLTGAALGASALGVLSAGLLAVTVSVVVLHVVTARLRAVLLVRRPRWVPAVRPLVLAALLFGAFLAVARSVRSGGWWTTWDGPVLSWFLTHRTDRLNTVATVLTQLGSPVASAVASAAVAVLLWRSGGARVGGWVLGGAVAAGAVILVAKVVVGRDRPPVIDRLAQETGPSFPSGHVTGALVLYGAVAVLLHARVRTATSRAVVLGVGLAVAATAVVRLYLGVHWLSDVLAAVLLGGALLALGVGMLRTVVAERAEPVVSGAGVPTLVAA